MDAPRYYIELKLPGKITASHDFDGYSKPVKDMTLIALESGTAEVVDTHRIFGEINEGDYYEESEPLNTAFVIVEASILEGWYPPEEDDFEDMMAAFIHSFKINEHYLESSWEIEQLDAQYFILAEVN